MINPCGEISLGKKEPVVPWVQFHWMQAIRCHQGLPPYTREECDQILKELGSSYEESFGLSKHIHDQHIRPASRK